MKHLFVCRHAKSSWNYPELSDYNRPLNERGERTAPLMADFLNANEIKPELIISSSANRAISTANIYNNRLKAELVENKDLYHIDYMELFHVICALPNNKNNIALVGHNPGLTNIINYLTDYDLGNLPTAGVAYIKFNINDWREVSAQTGEVIWIEYPKSIEVN